MSKIIGIDLGTTNSLCSSYGRRKAGCYRKYRRCKNNPVCRSIYKDR